MAHSRSEVRLDSNLQGQPQSRPHEPAAPSDPFKILIAADLSGRASRGECDPETIAKRQLTRLDRDNFDEVIAAMTPTLHLPFGASGTNLEVAFRDLDDFHPDALYERVEVFDRMRSLRDRLNNPQTAQAAIEELTEAIEQPAEEAKPTTANKDDDSDTDTDTDGGSLLESALQATESAPSQSSGSSLVDRLVREFVSPHSIPRQDARVPDLVADVERAMSGEMRALLTATPFQELEALWRSLYQLIRRLDTDRKLQLDLLDVTRDELRTAFAGTDDPLKTGLAKHLVDRAGETAGGVPYAVVVADFAAAPNSDDVQLVDNLATVSARASSVLLCGATSEWVGCAEGFTAGPDPDDWKGTVDDEVLQQWAAFRGRSEAASVGMVLPRALARQPYGKRSSPTTCFAFEEERGTESGDYRHNDLLWGNAAFLVTMLLGQTFERDGWQMQLLASDEVHDLPVHIRTIDGQSEAVPTAEIELSSSGADRMSSLGMMPLFSVRGTDSVRLGALRSVSSNATNLNGRWV